MIIDPTDAGQWDTLRPKTAYEADALAFCRAWRGGQSTFVLPTSGSTGTPKPITLSRAQMQASARLTGQALSLEPGDPALVCLNIRYVAGIMMLVRGLELCLPLTIVEPSANPLATFNPNVVRFAFAAFVPLQVQTMLDQPAPDTLALLNSMKAILIGGAATSPALEEALQTLEAPVYATYGMTETVSHIALRRLNGPLRSAVFSALPNVTLGTDARGCLHITSAATNFLTVQTNDVVDLTDATHFRLLGRADRIINSGGVKVQPERIEQLIEQTLATVDQHPLRQYPLRQPPRLFIAGLPDERLGQRIVLFLENHAIAPAVWETIQHRIRERIGPYALVREVFTVPEFIETPTGKIDRMRTIERYT